MVFNVARKKGRVGCTCQNVQLAKGQFAVRYLDKPKVKTPPGSRFCAFV